MACLSKLGGAAPPAPLDPPLLMEGLLRLGMPNSIAFETWNDPSRFSVTLHLYKGKSRLTLNVTEVWD